MNFCDKRKMTQWEICWLLWIDPIAVAEMLVKYRDRIISPYRRQVNRIDNCDNRLTIAV